jgi:hypothetical protein
MLTPMRLTRILAMGLAVAAGAALFAQQVDVSSIGPRIGDRVTDFRLTDQHGREQSIAGAAGPKGTMLVFFRSADW